ncbi:hypothetical protein B0T20DRAFT_446468 [Sordaria brevicollis]|uniref:Uncharacterized protein n=1 Tax=Sordaria brevicollis TaxID=83679 RepID=A0AAE0P137_SORBR|nr:hypothetical protein B0T20DRAFT_446468 [Sordaria brevicollis]
MSVSTDKTELDKMLAPSIEAIIAKARHEDFAWDRDLLTTHMPLDANTLEVICRVNLPRFVVRRDPSDDVVAFTEYGLERNLNFICQPSGETNAEKSPAILRLTVRQCNSYLNAMKSMRDIFQEAGRNTWSRFKPSMHGEPGNYGLENPTATRFVWVRLTTVVKLQHLNYKGSSTGTVIDVRGLATTLDRAMKSHEGPVSTVPKACITSSPPSTSFLFRKYSKGLIFRFCPDTDSHREFIMKQEKRNFWVNGVENYDPVNGKTADGVLNYEIRVTCKKVGAKAQLVIRFAHKTSMWSTDKVFELQDDTIPELSDTEESLKDLPPRKRTRTVSKYEPATS